MRLVRNKWYMFEVGLENKFLPNLGIVKYCNMFQFFFVHIAQTYLNKTQHNIQVWKFFI
jgi:hypothetical protein